MKTQILVVDDESVTRRVVTHTLKSIQVEVMGAENATEALALAAEHSFAMALIDINLPDMSGFELLERLNAMEHLRDIPKLIFTARNHSGDEDIAREAGAAGFLYKPFSTQELRDLVTHHLSA